MKEFADLAVSTLKNQTAKTFSRVVRFIVWLTVFVLVWTVVILIATLLYSIFYWLITPDIMFEYPVHMDYASAETPFAYARIDRQLSQCNTSELVADLYEANPPLLAGYPYDTYVEFRIADTVRNREGGMIVWKLTLFNQDEQVLYTSSRTFVLPHVMRIIRIVRSYFMMVPLLLDVHDQSRVYSVNILENFVEHSVSTV